MKNFIEKEWIDSAKQVKQDKEAIDHAKSCRMVYRINKKAYELALVEHKKAMNAAMRAGNYAEVSRNHKVINILRAHLNQECHAIHGKTLRIKVVSLRLAMAEQRRDQFADAYRLMEARDQLAMANAQIMADVPVIPMEDGDMEQIVKDLGY